MCDRMDFDRAIHLTGYGKFHYEAFTACAICIITVGFQNGLAAYIFPAAQCELNLSSFELSLLNVGFLVGGITSSFLWGVLADFKGRRPVLVFTHFSNFFVTLFFVVNPSVFSLIACRTFNGFLIGGPGSIVFSYLSEFQPKKYRSSVICYSGIFFTLAWLLLPILAYVILPIKISLNFANLFVITSWRLFMIILILPELLVGFWFLRLPESPKFHISKGDEKNALCTLRTIYSRNNNRSPLDFPVKSLLCNKKNNCDDGLKTMFEQFLSLFKSPLLVLSILGTSIMFTNMFGVFGLGWWLPELFLRFERFHRLHPQGSVSVRELALLPAPEAASCEPAFDRSVTQSTAIVGAATLLANAASGFMATRVSLRTVPCATMLVGGGAAASIYFLTSSGQLLAAAAVFQAAMVTANMTIGSVVVALFPTRVGAVAICLAMCGGRAGAMVSNLVFGLFMDSNCEVPIFAVSVGVLLGAACCFAIPGKTKDGTGGNVELSTVMTLDTKM